MSRLTEAEREAVHLLHWAPINSTPAGCPLCIDAVATMEAILTARLADACEALGSILLQKAAAEFDTKGPRHDRGAGVWDCGVWLREGEALVELEALAPAAEGDAGVGS